MKLGFSRDLSSRSVLQIPAGSLELGRLKASFKCSAIVLAELVVAQPVTEIGKFEELLNHSD